MMSFNNARVAPVRFGYGLGMERFERFRFSVPAVPLMRRFLCASVQFSREDGSGFGSWRTVPAVLVPRSVPGKTVPTVPVSGSGSVPAPPCNTCFWNQFPKLSPLHLNSEIPLELFLSELPRCQLFGALLLP